MITKLNKKSVVLQNLSLQSGTAFLSYEELASLAKLQERLTDENDVNDFITRSANVPGSTEIASCVAKKYMDDPSLMDNLVVKTRFFLNLGYYFVPALSKAIDAIEEDITPVNEVCGMIPSLARDIAANFLELRNPARWDGNGDVPNDTYFSSMPLDFPIDNAYPNQTIRLQFVQVSKTNPHYVCACSIFEDESHAGITEKCTKRAGSVKEIEDAILFVSRIYELREGFSRDFVETVNMYPTEYRAIRKALYGEEALGGSTGVIFSNKVLFKDGSVMTITYTGDGKGKAWGEAVLTEKDSEKIVAQSPISYTFANHWKLCFKGAVYHAFIKITQ